MKFKTFLKEGFNYGEKSESSKKKALDILKSLEGKDSIANPVWGDLKYYANAYIENKYQDLQETLFYPILHKRDYAKQPTEEEYLYITPALHTFESSAKKVAKVPKSGKYKVFYDALEKWFKDELPFVNKVNYWRDKIVKRVPGAAKEQKQQEIRRILKTNVDVKNVVEMIANDFRPQLENEYLKFVTGVMDRKIKDNKIIFTDRNDYSKQIIQGYIDPVKYPFEYKPKPNYKKLIIQDAKMRADGIIQDFISKIVLKLNTILTKKGNLQNVKRLGTSTTNNDIYMEFADGSKFKMTNKIVYSFSKYGLAFTRYPSTFHDVYLPSGAKMGQPSEANMINIFAIAT